MQDRQRILREFTGAYADEAGGIENKKQKFQAALNTTFEIDFDSDEHKTFTQQVFNTLYESLYYEGLGVETLDLSERHTQAKVDLTKQTVELFENFIKDKKAEILADTNKQKTIIRMGGSALLYKNLSETERSRTFFAAGFPLLMEFDKEELYNDYGRHYIFESFPDFQKEPFIEHLIKEKKLAGTMIYTLASNFSNFEQYFCYALQNTSCMEQYDSEDFEELYNTLKFHPMLRDGNETLFKALGIVANFMAFHKACARDNANPATLATNRALVNEFLSFVEQTFVAFSEAEKESFLKHKSGNKSMYNCLAQLSAFTGNFRSLYNLTKPFTDEKLKELNRHVNVRYESVTNIVDNYFCAYQKQWTYNNLHKFVASTAICSLAIYAAFAYNFEIKGADAVLGLASVELGIAANVLAYELLKPRASEYGLQRFYLN